MNKLGFAILVCVCLTASACGGDDDDSAGATKNGNGLGNGPWDPQACSPMAQQQQSSIPQGCTQAEIDAYSECISTACEGTLQICYGPNYRSGKFTGACKEAIDCAVKGCKCNDSACVNDCPGSPPCTQCFLDNPCGTDCKIPLCGIKSALADSGISIDLDKTCDDLLKCCATMEPSKAKQCTDTVEQFQMIGAGQADLQCATFFEIYGAGSKAAACQ